MKHEIQQTVELQGRYKGIKHKGHKFDENGELVEFGEVIEETGWGKNIITIGGINALLSGSVTYLFSVAGTGNTTPSESDTVLASYAGKMAAWPVSESLVRQVNPATELYLRFTTRATYNPGAFGASSVNIAEAGMTLGTSNLAAVGPTTNLFSRGLLVDSGGLPTTIAVAPDEYLDIIWEFTMYIPYDATGTVNLMIDGVSTSHTYYVRPIRLDGALGSGTSWFSPAYASAGTGAGAINAITVSPPQADFTSGWALGNTALTTPTVTPTGTALTASSTSQSAYVSNSKQRQYNAIWTLTNGNAAAPGVSIVSAMMGWPSFQVSYSPPIAKTASKQLNLSFMLSFANR